MKESDVTKKAMEAMREAAARLGTEARFVKIVASDGQEAGVSDILGCVGGRFVAVEMKKPGYPHKLSALQALYLDDVERAGGYSAVCAFPDEAAGAVLAAAMGKGSQWRTQADARAFPGRDRAFPLPTFVQ